MPSTFKSQEAAIRKQLHTDMQTAWIGLSKIFDDQPEQPNKTADLPVAFCFLSSVNNESDEASLTMDAADLIYELTLRATKDPNTSLQASKIAACEALRGILTTGKRYVAPKENGQAFNREWLDEKYMAADADQAKEEASQTYYQVTLRFQVTITYPAF